MMGDCGLDSCGLENSKGEGSCEHSHKSSPIQCRKIDRLRNYQLPRKDPAPEVRRNRNIILHQYLE